ncbi:aldose 1-epimerase family protein [Candidatus Clostridium radicumherbarum]|uniref:Aldose 1-epimerase family protein n=1 Tax=Candidatus Clostridium radicumherbarum TaxID=3381662 RepID=A0ABW8TXK8_9CLOT
MNYSLENALLKITLNDHGAELHNIKGKKENIEFLWNGDEEYWKYHAPVLFPIVGKMLNSKYIVDGNTYTLPQHGLARVSEFKKTTETESSITFNLDYSEETLKVYPFRFSFEIEYTLDNNSIIIKYKVINRDNKNMLFSIGAHPAFMCPILPNESLEDYYFEFSKNETASIMELSEQGYFTHKEFPYLNGEKIVALSKEVFKNDALVFHNLNSHIIYLKAKNHNKFVEFDFENFPYLGLWSKPTGAPFVCIEPWFGHADFEDFNGELKDKEGIISLEENNAFTCCYKIIIHQ